MHHPQGQTIPVSGVSREQLELARGADLLTYLQAYESSNLRQVGGKYCLQDHDSLKISNGFFHWNSRGIGGKRAQSEHTSSCPF